ncbi:MAG TPA: PKD domain-containing protein [Vicinamibacterales bacterium]|nr:PKD domain-containing protein [Vicinamibacterales bacterium]
MLKNIWTAAAVGLITIAGCTLDTAAIPPLAGPSEAALSLAVTATPDLIPQDGAASSLVEIVARDAGGHPVRGLALDLVTFVNSVRMDHGSLSSRRISTGKDGRALVTYYAPATPPNAADDVTVAVVVTPVGTNFANERARTVLIRLVRPGLVLPPNRPPAADFFFSPASPREGDAVLFDGSRSIDDGQIVSFVWSFGDGGVGAGMRSTHRYQVAGTYNVVLTVTDDRGAGASTTPTPIVVTSSSDPVAAFTVSPAEPAVGQPVILNASASKAAAGRSITSFVWDFGDGSSPGSGMTTSHPFNGPGSYTVVLNVTDSTGRKGTASQTVTIKPAAK